MTDLFYIMQNAVDVLSESEPAYTPLTNHKTELHSVPLVMLSEYRKLIEIIEDIKQMDISASSPSSNIDSGIRSEMADAIRNYEQIEKELLL